MFPIVLGNGVRMWRDTHDATALELVESQRLESGTMILTYRPARAAPFG